ncbi:MAG: hypothetical protein HY791_23880 [Deltaproteobacteria bacterium]|nr:hypothetical protein [Deltaproteobacteria bacterium]
MRKRRSACVLCLTAFWICSAGTSLAGPEPGGKRVAAELAASAEDAAAKGLEAFQAGRDEQAAELFLQAYRISGHPSPLRNAAKALERAGQLERSLSLWLLYQKEEITPDERAEADAHLALIKERQRSAALEQAAQAAKADAAAARAEATMANRPDVVAVSPIEPEPTSLLGPLLVIGSGGASTLAGAALFLVSASRLSDVDARLAERDEFGKIKGISPSELTSELDGVNAQRTAGGALLLLGIAALSAGGAWLLYY